VFVMLLYARNSWPLSGGQNRIPGGIVMTLSPVMFFCGDFPLLSAPPVDGLLYIDTLPAQRVRFHRSCRSLYRRRARSKSRAPRG